MWKKIIINVYLKIRVTEWMVVAFTEMGESGVRGKYALGGGRGEKWKMAHVLFHEHQGARGAW